MDSPPRPPSLREGGARWVGAGCGVVAVLYAAEARGDEVLTFDGTVMAGPPNHVTIEFTVPATTREIQIEHDDLDADDILDWGLTSPSGFRGWGGGNGEPAIVTALAASRSYLAGPIEAGTWKVDIGKAKIVGDSASYHVVVTLRDVPTLAPQSERAAYVAPAPLETGRRWYAGDFHVHSRESGDATATFDEIVTLAKDRGLDFVELSDHNTTAQLDFMNYVQSRAGGLLLIPGVEFTTYAGHANGIGATAFVDHKFDPSAAAITAAADAFRAQGALFALNHPALDIGDACIGCAWKQELPADRIDAVEVVTAGSAQIFYEDAAEMWESIVAARGEPVAAIGGSDDHRAGMDIGAFGTPIGSPCTMVEATELSVAGILQAVREGKTVVKVRGPDDPMVEMAVSINDEEGAGAVLRARITGGIGLDARVVADGVPGDFVPIDDDPFTLPTPVGGEPGQRRRFRVEVFEGLTPVTITSHIFVGATGPASRNVYPAGGGACAHAPGEHMAAFGASLGLLALAGGARFMRRRRR